MIGVKMKVRHKDKELFKRLLENKYTQKDLPE